MKSHLYIFSLLFLLTSFVQPDVRFKTLYEEEYQPGDKIKPPEIWFDLGGAHRPLQEFGDSIIEISKFMELHPKMIVEIGSHTDSRGTDRMNLLLTDKRAESVKNFVIENCESCEGRVRAKGYGESELIYPDKFIAQFETKEEQEFYHQENRRVIITVLSIK